MYVIVDVLMKQLRVDMEVDGVDDLPNPQASGDIGDGEVEDPHLAVANMENIGEADVDVDIGELVIEEEEQFHCDNEDDSVAKAKKGKKIVRVPWSDEEVKE